MSSTEDQKSVGFRPNEPYAKKLEDDTDMKSRADVNIVNIPKENLGFVNLGSYHISQSMEHMPLVRIIEVNLFPSLFVGISKITFAVLIKAKFFQLCLSS